MKRIVVCCLLSSAIGLSMGCASGGGDGSQAAPKVVVEVPASSPLAQIELGMNDTDVRRVLGDPARSNSYMTGKNFIPFYYGPDVSRSDWMYPGVGRVVFSRNRYSNGLKVIRLIHNPDEP